MLGITAFDLRREDVDLGQIIQENHHFSERRTVNGFEEELITWIHTNEMTDSGYRNYRIITDEVLDYRVRIRGEVLDQVIKQGWYEVYYHPTRHRLVALCKKEEAFKVAKLFQEKFDLLFEKHTFNILEIIRQSSDVSGARFEVQIETVSGISLRGNNIHNTQYYANMLQAGELKGVTVKFDYGDRTVTFFVSIEGTLLFYSALEDHEYLNFIDMLYSFDNR